MIIGANKSKKGDSGSLTVAVSVFGIAGGYIVGAMMGTMGWKLCFGLPLAGAVLVCGYPVVMKMLGCHLSSDETELEVNDGQIQDYSTFSVLQAAPVDAPV